MFCLVPTSRVLVVFFVLYIISDSLYSFEYPTFPLQPNNIDITPNDTDETCDAAEYARRTFCYFVRFSLNLFIESLIEFLRTNL